MKTTVTCIKVSNLRKQGYSNLREWMNVENNIYVGRHGRIFIDKVIFHYPSSKWHNPYKLKDYKVNKSLILYVKYLFAKGLITDIEELRGKNLGCFCDHHKDKNNTPTCHAQVLADILNNCSDILYK